MGPLGVATHTDGIKKVCIVGGGVGCAIALPAAEEFHRLGAEVTSIIGFRSKDLLILEDEFQACSDRLIVMTDDGSYARHGNVTVPLKEMLEKICKVNDDDKSYSEVLESGKRSGVVSARMRQYGYERELLAYQRCSREYEIKLRRQADLFLQETNRWKSKRKEYEALLDEYEATIAELEEVIAQNGSSEYKQRLSSVKEYKDRLESLGN